MSKYDPSKSTTISGIISLSITLLTVCMVPIDVFLVSFMKNSDGSFKEWANSSETRNSVENTVEIAYYTLYALTTFCLFLLLPFMYFFYEEKDDVTNSRTCKSRFCIATKYTVVFVIIVSVLMLIGGLVPAKTQPNQNSTDWDNVKNLFMQLGTNDAEDALSFVISVLSLIGMLSLITYTAYGMSALPMSLIKGHSSAKTELERIRQKQTENKARIQAMRDKYGSGGRSSRNRQPNLSQLEEDERLLERQESHLEDKNTCLHKCLVIFRPFEMVIGVALQLLTLLIFLSLLLTNIDKAIHGKGYKLGYVLPKRTLPNPIDIVLVFCQKAFPLDYILFTAIVMYLIFCSMSGVRNIGIWFMWLKMYKIRPRRTRPQGILLLCMILMFIILAINIIVYQLTPQYSMYGSQMVPSSSTTGNRTEIKYELKHCSLDSSPDGCTITRMAFLLTRFFFKMWFFGAAYYWTTWVFLGFIVIGFLVALIKKRKSSIDGEVDEDDFDESDEEMVHA